MMPSCHPRRLRGVARRDAPQHTYRARSATLEWTAPRRPHTLERGAGFLSATAQRHSCVRDFSPQARPLRHPIWCLGSVGATVARGARRTSTPAPLGLSAKSAGANPRAVRHTHKHPRAVPHRCSAPTTAATTCSSQGRVSRRSTPLMAQLRGDASWRPPTRPTLFGTASS